VFLLKLKVKDHPEDSISGQLMKNATDELLGNAPAVALDKDVGIKLPRKLGFARNSRNNR